MKSSARRISIILLVLLIAATSVARWVTHKSSASQRVVIAQAGDFFLYAPIYIALDAGFFRQEGLDVDIVSTGGDEKTWAAVIGGSAAFGVSDPTFVAIAGERGQADGRVVASVVNGVPFWGITRLPGLAPFSSASDLKGHTVATFPSPSTAYSLQKKMFLDAGLEPSIKQGAFGTLLALLDSGNADIALELEPNVSQAAAAGAHVVYSMPALYGDFAITGLTTTTSLLGEHPETVQKVVCALQRALDMLHRDAPASLAILSHRFPEIDKDVATAAFDRVIHEGIIPETTVVSAHAWSQAIDLRRDVGDLRTSTSTEVYLQPRFSAHAAKDCRGGKASTEGASVK